MSTEDVMIHVRFAPDGSVTEIGERPAGATANKWFGYLSDRVGEDFQPLSGGRGVFRITRSNVESFKAAFLSG